MSRKLFHSTLEEKREMLKRLEHANSVTRHEDVETAIMVVRDAIALHTAHEALSDIKTSVANAKNASPNTAALDLWIRMIENQTKTFYEKIKRSTIKHS
jgi:hypothetical protein